MTWFEGLTYWQEERNWSETVMHPTPDLLRTAELNYEQWRDMLRPNWGLYTPDEPNGFVGRVRSRLICGLNASDISNNVRRCDRTQKDLRIDGVDHYYAVFQIAGRSTIAQDDNAATLGPGDVTLLDSARPLTYLNDGHAQWLSLQLPRRNLISHLGIEPQVGYGDRAGTRARRALYHLIEDGAEDKSSISAPVEKYMQLALYDLLGALFVPSDRAPTSIYNDKLFTRICCIIKDRFADPDFGPGEVAIEAGISLRYLQKLFLQRRSTCSEYIFSLRLDHAARLLLRREWLRTGEPISEIAYASGFHDYTHFGRRFRDRFGHSPSSYKGDLS